MKIEIMWPWEMVWGEYIDEIIAKIKDALPPDHELQTHELYPGIKWDGRNIFIVSDDTTDQSLLMNFEKRKRWNKTKYRVPTITVFKDRQEIADMIKRDHKAECAKYNSDGTLKG